MPDVVHARRFHPSKGVHQLLGAAFVNQTRNTLFTSS
jgi:hypothetical protein